MTIRLAALGLHHETNTFSPVRATLQRWEPGIVRGEDITDAYATSHATMGGFLAAHDRAGGVVVEPLVFANLNPMGIITAEAFEVIVAEMLEFLVDKGPFDGVLLAQHGAAVAERCADADGEVVDRVRDLVGPSVPVGLALDMHANVSRRMVDAATVTVAYQTNPHVDPRPRAVELADLVIRTVRGEICPVQHLETPPLVVDILRQDTNDQPMAGLVQTARDLVDGRGLLAASVLEGFPYADVPEMGMAFLAVADGDRSAAVEAAETMAQAAWAARHDLIGRAPSPAEAVAGAMTAHRGPVVLLDVGDNIGGGGPGDSTVLLAEALRQGAAGVLQTVFDPEAAAACSAAGMDETVTLPVGGRTDPASSQPVTVTGRVAVLSDGRYEEPTPTHGGWRFFDAGPTAVLECDGDVTLVVHSRRVPNTSLEQHRSVGVDPAAKQIVVAKGVNAPRAAYSRIAASMVVVDTPGVTAASLGGFAYTHRRVPMFPFEEDATYTPGLSS